MRQTIRMLILTVSVVGTFLVAAVPQVPAKDGGPIFVCPPSDKSCKNNLPPMMK